MLAVARILKVFSGASPAAGGTPALRPIETPRYAGKVGRPSRPQISGVKLFVLRARKRARIVHARCRSHIESFFWRIACGGRDARATADRNPALRREGRAAVP